MNLYFYLWFISDLVPFFFQKEMFILLLSVSLSTPLTLPIFFPIAFCFFPILILPNYWPVCFFVKQTTIGFLAINQSQRYIFTKQKEIFQRKQNTLTCSQCLLEIKFTLTFSCFFFFELDLNCNTVKSEEINKI